MSEIIISSIFFQEDNHKTYEKEDRNECNICFEIMEHKNISITKCGHSFCLDCMIKSLSLKTTCPTCREILIENKLSFSENNEPNNILTITPLTPYISDIDFNSDSDEESIIIHQNKTYDLFKMNELKKEVKDTIKLYLDMLSFRELKKYKKCSLKSFLKIPFDRCCENAQKEIYNIFFSHNNNLYHFAYTDIVRPTIKGKMTKKGKKSKKKDVIKPRFWV